jgi:serralysin
VCLVMKTTQVSSDLSSTDMSSLEDSLSFDGAFPITFDLTGSDDLTVSRETSPLGVLNSNPSPSTISSESPRVPVRPANDLTAVSNFAYNTFTLADSFPRTLISSQPAHDQQDDVSKLFRDGWIGQDHSLQLFSSLHGGDSKASGPCTCSQCSLPPVDPRRIVPQSETLNQLPLPALDLTKTFSLNSLPGANHTIYLDFNGHTTTGTAWNTYSGKSSIVTPAFDLDGNTASFSATELERIQYIWQRVVEDFSPFNVNVTTQEPTLDRLIKSSTTDTAWGVRVAIGGSSFDWFGAGAGGVAYVGSFNWNSDTPTFVFSTQTLSDEKYTADAISHEVGHTLGLNHDGRTIPSEEYYDGHGSGETGWGPIMGSGYYQNLTQWSKGEYLAANNTEDDLAIITTQNGFGYRVDDTGNTLATAKALTVSGTAVSASGIIERNTDVDFFSFTTGAGPISLTVTPSGRSPNLDILAELYNSAGVLVASSNPADFLAASISATVGAGTYYLKVDGVGKGDPLGTGYTDYGSLGQYAISGSIISGTKSISIAKTTDGKEAGPVSSVFTLTRTGDLSSALTVNYTLAGTATPGVDYTGTTPNTVSFLAGSPTATITLPTIDDLLSDPSETIITTITAPAGYTISGPSTATATILDNDGNSGNNNLVGTSFADALAGVGGNDTLDGGAGNDTLDGGADNDTYLFDTDLVLGSDRLIDASGIDTLNFAATTTKTINLNLGSTVAQTVTAGNLTLTLASATAFENVIGGSLNDNIVGNTLNNSLTGGLGKDSLTGSTGLDTLNYNSLGESLLSGFDVIQGYIGTGASLDSINAPGSIAAITLTASKGTATALTEAAIQLVLTNAAFAANTAAAFTVTGQSGTFIALNNGDNGAAGFQAASDAIIQLSGYNIAAATPVVVI